MEIILTATHAALEAAWREHCGDLPGVRVHGGSILDVDADAWVSPANSRGVLGGGVDLAYARHFGPGLERRLRAEIERGHGGELAVGAAVIVPTALPAGTGRPPWLIAAPTMRRPMRIVGTDHAYRAAAAVLGLIGRSRLPDAPWAAEIGARPVADVVRRVAFPGLGTGTGGLPAGECAAQVRRAILAWGPLP